MGIFNLGFSIWFSRKVMDKSNELDFSSTEFNALDALTNNVDIPVPEAPVYDNLGQFISTVRNRGRSRPNHDQAGPSNQDDRWNTSRRRFLPHQEPVMGRGRSRILRNVLTRMDEVTRGPMSVLRNCMLSKTRVKVWIRGPKWIRGFCMGCGSLRQTVEFSTDRRRRNIHAKAPQENANLRCRGTHNQSFGSPQHPP